MERLTTLNTLHLGDQEHGKDNDCNLNKMNERYLLNKRLLTVKYTYTLINNLSNLGL